MDCTGFVARFTDYLDGALPPAESQAMEEHIVACGSCLRYKTVVEQGRSVLLSLPGPELRGDFATRLEHRILHVADERALPDEVASRAPALAVLGVAALLTVVAWSPVLIGGAPSVHMAPIVVDHAPASLPPRSANGAVMPASGSDTLPQLDQRLWDNARLYEYSPLSRRYQEPARARQVGLGSNR